MCIIFIYHLYNLLYQNYKTIQVLASSMSANDNNFKLPPISQHNAPFSVPNDNDILLENQNHTKSRLKEQKIWDKGTSSCRNPLKRFDKFETVKDDKYVPVNSFNNKEKKLIENALEIIQMRKKNKDLVGKNQTIVDILEQKKEMFLVTMTHGIIQSEIKNLKGQADDRQKALKESDQMLGQDMKDFEQFQEREKNQTKNIEEKYEKQVQRRLAKQQEIKSKQIIFNSLRAEKSRNEENISLYEKYKKFLNQLPPEQWKLFQQKKKQDKLEKVRQKMFRQWAIDHDLKKNSEQKLKLEFNSTFQKLKESGDDEEIQEILNDQEMYFKEPHELIEYFNNLQETNLFYIQNVQATDQKLQQLIAKSQERKRELMTKYQTQLQQKKSLQKQLVQLQNQIKILKRKNEQNSAIDEKDNKDIKATIANQYMNMKEQMTHTYLPEIEHNAEALTFLSRIEICMERLWDRLREYFHQNPKLIKEIKNSYQKKKTVQKREEAARNNKEEQLRRKQRNLDKKQPTQRMHGRLDMKRSAPNQKLIKKKTVEKSKDINNDLQYLVE